jgi:glycosyltransferase involved in cell wall biosynthesis
MRYLGSVGVDLVRFDPSRISAQQQKALRQFFKIPPQAYPIVGTIGRINEKKGSLYLIEAIHELRSQFPNIHALIIGAELSTDPDGCRDKAVRRIQELELEPYITLTGYRDDIPELVSLMDIFTLPTSTHEGLPSAVIEAMAMEKPVIASDIRGCREAIIPQKTGLIIPPKNSQALAQALRGLLADFEKAKKIIEGKVYKDLYHTQLGKLLQHLPYLLNQGWFSKVTEFKNKPIILLICRQLLQDKVKDHQVLEALQNKNQ